MSHTEKMVPNMTVRTPRIAQAQLGSRQAAKYDVTQVGPWCQRSGCRWAVGPRRVRSLSRVNKVLVYLGLDGSHTQNEWARAIVAVLPPLLLAAAVTSLDGVQGLTGWFLNVVYLTFAFALWLPLVARSLPPARP